MADDKKKKDKDKRVLTTRTVQATVEELRRALEAMGPGNSYANLGLPKTKKKLDELKGLPHDLTILAKIFPPPSTKEEPQPKIKVETPAERAAKDYQKAINTALKPFATHMSGLATTLNSLLTGTAPTPTHPTGTGVKISALEPETASALQTAATKLLASIKPLVSKTGEGDWPEGTPTWMKSVLETMQKSGDLNGITPDVIASIAKGESGFEKTGAGINSSGYGGYLGESEHTLGSQLLLSSTPKAFEQQAQYAAAKLASYPGTVWEKLNEYVNGTETPAAKIYAAMSPDAQVYYTTVASMNNGTPALAGAEANISGQIKGLETPNSGIEQAFKGMANDEKLYAESIPHQTMLTALLGRIRETIMYGGGYYGQRTGWPKYLKTIYNQAILATPAGVSTATGKTPTKQKEAGSTATPSPVVDNITQS